MGLKPLYTLCTCTNHCKIILAIWGQKVYFSCTRVYIIHQYYTTNTFTPLEHIPALISEETSGQKEGVTRNR